MSNKLRENRGIEQDATVSYKDQEYKKEIDDPRLIQSIYGQQKIEIPVSKFDADIFFNTYIIGKSVFEVDLLVTADGMDITFDSPIVLLEVLNEDDLATAESIFVTINGDDPDLYNPPVVGVINPVFRVRPGQSRTWRPVYLTSPLRNRIRLHANSLVGVTGSLTVWTGQFPVIQK